MKCRFRPKCVRNLTDKVPLPCPYAAGASPTREMSAHRRWRTQMTNLVVDAIRCVEETDEVGSDDVYIVIFRGDPKPPFSSNLGVHGPGSFWRDLDSGDLRD